jgi:hypothetical protein
LPLRAEQRGDRLCRDSPDGAQVLLQEPAVQITVVLVGWAETVRSYHGGGNGLQQRVGEDGAGSIRYGSVGLEVSGDEHYGHAEGSGEAGLHADSVVQARSVQHGDHAGDPAQPGAVELEQGTALAAGHQILLVGVAERQEHAVGS